MNPVTIAVLRLLRTAKTHTDLCQACGAVAVLCVYVIPPWEAQYLQVIMRHIIKGESV